MTLSVQLPCRTIVSTQHSTTDHCWQSDARPGSQTMRGTEAGGLIAWPCVAPPSPASAAPHMAPSLHQHHAQPQRPRLLLHHLWLWHPSRTHFTTHVALRLRGSHRHCLYISSRHRQRPYRWLLRSTLTR
jgi:hypothetical protein